MKSAVTISDAQRLTREDIYDLDGAYREHLSKIPRSSRQGVFHPSQVGGCGRRNVYEYIRTPALSTTDPESMEVFDLGHAIHDIIQSRMEILGSYDPHCDVQYDFVREVPYDPSTDKLISDFGIGGTCDGILKIWTADWAQRGILEVKSSKDKNFHALEARTPKEEHLLQGHIYAYRFDCPIIWIWYYNKDTSERRVFPCVFQWDILMVALKKFEAQLAHAEAGTLPDREENWFMCPRCEYRDTCKPDIINAVKRKKIREINKKVRRPARTLHGSAK